MKKSEQYQYSDNTPAKQEAFSKALRFHMGIVQTIWNKHSFMRRVYHYFDLYGGPGIDPEGNEGSPLIFVRTAQEKRIQYQARVWESKSETCLALALNTRGIPSMTIYNEDHNKIDKQHLAPCDPYGNGVAYCDPSNAHLPVAACNQISHYYPKVDVMVYLAASSYKRAVTRQDYEDLEKQLLKIKPYWTIKKPFDKHQWTFLIGTSWSGFPAWESEQFYNFLSPVGAEYFERVCYTKKQIQAKRQPPLFESAPTVYSEYLKHPTFRAIRQKAMEKAKWTCQRCKKARATEVHHLKYPPWGEWDIVENLLPVCHPCHCEIEGKDN